jgi:hypothetical protein
MDVVWRKGKFVVNNHGVNWRRTTNPISRYSDLAIGASKFNFFEISDWIWQGIQTPRNEGLAWASSVFPIRRGSWQNAGLILAIYKQK